MTATPHKATAVAALLINALVWGVSWWPFKNLQALGLHPLWSTAWVYLLAFVMLVVVFVWRGLWPSQTWRHPGLWALWLASGLTNVGFNWAVTVGDVVRVVLLFYLMPAWSVLVAWWLLGERPHARALWRLALALCGLVIVLKTPETPWPVPQSLPDVLALLGGLSFAVTNALLLKLRDTPDSARMLAMFGGGASMAALTALMALGAGIIAPVPDVSGHVLAWAPWALALSTAFLFGNFALQLGAAHLPAHTTALVMLSEVVFASVSSYVLGASEWSLRTAAGGSLIVLAALLAVGWPERASHVQQVST